MGPGTPDGYALLGVEPDVSAKEIRAAYLRRIRLAHPDRNRDAPPAVRAEAERLTCQLNDAWAVLGGGSSARRGQRPPCADGPEPYRQAVGLVADAVWALLDECDSAEQARGAERTRKEISVSLDMIRIKARGRQRAAWTHPRVDASARAAVLACEALGAHLHGTVARHPPLGRRLLKGDTRVRLLLRAYDRLTDRLSAEHRGLLTYGPDADALEEWLRAKIAADLEDRDRGGTGRVDAGRTDRRASGRARAHEPSPAPATPPRSTATTAVSRPFGSGAPRPTGSRGLETTIIALLVALLIVNLVFDFLGWLLF